MLVKNTTIELDSQTARALAEYAASLGLSIQDYLKKHFADSNGAGNIDDPDKWLDELAFGLPELPALPCNFSTRDAYMEHD